jgi:Holliday junction DNA helicase RuvB
MEDFRIEIVLNPGPHARTVRVNLEPFTLVGATTREGLLTAPLRARFGIMEKLEPYPWQELRQIVQRSATILSLEVDEDAAELIARRSRGTPRIANRLLHRIRDVACVRSSNRVSKEMAEEGLARLGVDNLGLGTTDRKILKTIIDHGGGPVGLKTIAVSVGEEERTIEEVYEPYLIRQSLLQRTARGRKVTALAYKHLGIMPPASVQQGPQKQLFT